MAAKRVVVSAGRAAKAITKEGAQRAVTVTRVVITGGTRTVTAGVQQAAHSVADSAASALQSVADHLEPQPPLPGEEVK